MTDEPPWEELDPGIEPVVRALWNAGYEPTDSGDGSKHGTMECALPVPHVFCAAALRHPIDVHNICRVLDRAGIQYTEVKYTYAQDGYAMFEVWPILEKAE